MPKYCPKCESEFTDNINTCPTDNEVLTKKPPAASTDYFVDIYAAAEEIEAERIMSFLAASGIRARESVSGLSQLPVASDTRFIVCVEKTNVKKARDAIKQAREDKIISESGSFL